MKKSITIKELEIKINKVFKENFGDTPFSERLKDITNEFFELMRYRTLENLEEELGDLICSLIMLAIESKWDVEKILQKTLDKIERRKEQYRSLGRKTKVALYGIAGNPIHRGHIQMAQFVLDTTNEIDEVWITPCYQHMYHKELISPEHRLEMARIAASVDKRIIIYDYEIVNKFHGETYYFVKRLNEEKELIDKYQFSMIIGQDNANTFHKWVNYQELERMMRFIVVPREGVDRDPNVDWYLKQPHIFLNKEKTGIVETSSTEIREMFKQPITELSKQLLLKVIDENVYNYILTNDLYK